MTLHVSNTSMYLDKIDLTIKTCLYKYCLYISLTEPDVTKTFF